MRRSEQERPKPSSLQRGWFVGVALLIAAVAIGGTWYEVHSKRGGGARPSPAARAPAADSHTGPEPITHVVLFLIDTLRADRLGAYGYRGHQTSPTIDLLAQHGVVFEQATAAAPWTIQSVASLFTSTYPCEHNMLSEFDRLSDSADTLAERMKRAGYSTYSLFGNAFVGPQFGMSQGFDHLRPSGRNGGAEVEALLGATPALPFFVYVHNMEPHDPYYWAPPRTPGFRDVSPDVRAQIKTHFLAYKAAGEYDYRQRLKLGTNDKTAEQDQELAVLRTLQDDWNELYDASVLFADSRIGSLIQMLQKHGWWDDTLFIVVGDHGEEIGDHGGWLHDQSVYQELMHVPLVMRFPHDRFAGQRVAAPVSLVDVLPTILDAVGRADLATGTRGKSLMPLARGETSERGDALLVPGMRINTTRYYLPWAETRGNVNIVVRRGAWKGIWNADLNTFELYDLSVDPREHDNLASAHPDLVTAMRSHAETWYARCRESKQATGTVDLDKLDQATLRNLRALGYISGGEDEEHLDDGRGR